LIHEQGAEVEAALWMALRSLEDRAALSRMLADRAEAGGRPISARRFRADLDDMARSIAILRRLVHTDDVAGAMGERAHG
jgi:two-component system chemotaxis response regulator CheB